MTASSNGPNLPYNESQGSKLSRIEKEIALQLLQGFLIQEIAEIKARTVKEIR